MLARAGGPQLAPLAQRLNTSCLTMKTVATFGYCHTTYGPGKRAGSRCCRPAFGAHGGAAQTNRGHSHPPPSVSRSSQYALWHGRLPVIPAQVPAPRLARPSSSLRSIHSLALKLQRQPPASMSGEWPHFMRGWQRHGMLSMHATNARSTRVMLLSCRALTRIPSPVALTGAANEKTGCHSSVPAESFSSTSLLREA